MTLYHFAGDAPTRGRACGETLSVEIRKTLSRVVGDIGGDDEVTRFLSETNFEPAIALYTPDLLAELNAIADGAGVSRNHLLVHNLMDEHWWWSQTSGHREACSTLAMALEPPLLGQTMDLPVHLDGSQVAIRTTYPEGTSVVLLTSAGLIGLCGASSGGFAVCVNALTTLDHSSTGLPVAFVIRGALAQPDVDSAVDFIRSVPHASGQHYAVVGHRADGSVATTSLEASGSGVVTAATPDSTFAHTNHPLRSTHVDHSMVGTVSDSELRQSVLEAGSRTLASLDELCALLSKQPLCIKRDSQPEWFTFATLSVELGTPLTVRYALGPASQESWHTTSLTTSLGNQAVR